MRFSSWDVLEVHGHLQVAYYEVLLKPLKHQAVKCFLTSLWPKQNGSLDRKAAFQQSCRFSTSPFPPALPKP